VVKRRIEAGDLQQRRRTGQQRFDQAECGRQMLGRIGDRLMKLRNE
jgi:hypothetical protein